MALEEDLEKLKEATLRRLALPELPRVEHAENSFKVECTVLGPREELEEPLRESLALRLAEKARIAIKEKVKERKVVFIADARVDYSDDADCEGPGSTGQHLPGGRALLPHHPRHRGGVKPDSRVRSCFGCEVTVAL